MGRKIAFCGGGNMASGIIGGMIKRGGIDPADISVNELNPKRCEFLKENYGVAATTDAGEAMAGAETVFIAVVPKVVPVAAATIREKAEKDALVVSIAAGVRIADIASVLGDDRRIIRIMPNTLIQSGNGHSAICPGDKANADDVGYVSGLLQSIGQVLPVNEDMFDAFTAFSCSGPMWLYKIAESLVDAGVYVGFSRDDATRIVLKNMLGVATVLEETGDAPAERVAEMCTPGGVTVEGLKVLEEHGVKGSLMDSIIEAVEKVRRLG